MKRRLLKFGLCLVLSIEPLAHIVVLVAVVELLVRKRLAELEP